MSDRVDFSPTDEPWIEVMLSDGSDRYYLAETAQCLKRPVLPLFLGWRSCPPGRRIEGEIVECPVVQALADNDWRAAEWYRRIQASSVVLDVWREPADDDTGRRESIQDQPISVNVDTAGAPCSTTPFECPTRWAKPKRISPRHWEVDPCT
ncbi:type I-E CRISPR-associated protein Cas5/CasD [Stackebrandtia endophytica]|nr:type I-E CRISPR-associated protein Cas5/CasD [Stackebrandtia endophytica]